MSVEALLMSALTNETSMFIYLRVFFNEVTALLVNIFRLQRKLLVSAHNVKFLRELFEVLQDVVGVEEPNISPFAKALHRPWVAIVRFLLV